MHLLAKKPEQRPQHARAVIRSIRQVEHTPDSDIPASGQLVPADAFHVNTDYVERIQELERRVRKLRTQHQESHPAVVEARFELADLTGQSGDSRGAADRFESLGEDCKRYFGPNDRRALDAFDAMARWIASPS